MSIESFEIRQYGGITVEFFTAELPFYLYGVDDITLMFTVGLPGGEFVIVGRQDNSTKVDQLDAAIRWYHVEQNPPYRDFFYNPQRTTRGSWSFVDAEEELGFVLEWYQEHYPNGHFEPKQVLWPTEENVLPGEPGYSHGYYPQPVFKVPVECHPEMVLKTMINKKLADKKIVVVSQSGLWKTPIGEDDECFMHRTFGMVDYGLSELVMFSKWRVSVAEHQLMQIAETLLEVERGVEVGPVTANVSVSLTEVPVEQVPEKYLELWTKFFRREQLVVTQVMYSDEKDRYPNEEGYDWEQSPQPLLEAQ